MKKLLTTALALLMLIGMCACSTPSGNNNTEPGGTTPEQTTPDASQPTNEIKGVESQGEVDF